MTQCVWKDTVACFYHSFRSLVWKVGTGMWRAEIKIFALPALRTSTCDTWWRRTIKAMKIFWTHGSCIDLSCYRSYISASLPQRLLLHIKKKNQRFLRMWRKGLLLQVLSAWWRESYLKIKWESRRLLHLFLIRVNKTFGMTINVLLLELCSWRTEKKKKLKQTFCRRKLRLNQVSRKLRKLSYHIACYTRKWKANICAI